MTLALQLVLAVASAPASTIFGNPTISLELASGPDVEVLGLRGLTCPGHVDDVLGVTLSTSTPIQGALPADDYCGLAVAVIWEEDEDPELVPVDGIDDLTLGSVHPGLTVVLDPSGRTASLE